MSTNQDMYSPSEAFEICRNYKQLDPTTTTHKTTPAPYLSLTTSFVKAFTAELLMNKTNLTFHDSTGLLLYAMVWLNNKVRKGAEHDVLYTDKSQRSIVFI